MKLFRLFFLYIGIINLLHYFASITNLVFILPVSAVLWNNTDSAEFFWNY